jgi:hypothetical protein
MKASPIALSIKPGGKLTKLISNGRIATSGADVVTVEIDGEISEIAVAVESVRTEFALTRSTSQANCQLSEISPSQRTTDKGSCAAVRRPPHE